MTKKRVLQSTKGPAIGIKGAKIPFPKAEEIREVRPWSIAPKQAATFIIPQTSNTRAELLRTPRTPPTIQLTQKAILKIFLIVGAIEMEVGWLGTARREGDLITIDDVFLFDQDVSYGHTVLTIDSMSSIMSDVLTRPDGAEIFNTTRFWGHSHGSGGVYPSQKDDKTMMDLGGFCEDFFVRGIFNRIGGVSFSVYDWAQGIAFHDVWWTVFQDTVSEKEYFRLKQAIEEELLRRVTYTERRYKYTTPQQPSHNVFPIWDPRRYFGDGQVW
ncbi:hypothetical protein HYT05_03375 [Candidatus Kaiserbacteria bacterium]|nr:hypothetical protein [Candidatus Kaiserbacteria bacterium]